MKEIGLKLKEKREENGVTVEEAADDLKIRPNQVVNIEEGEISAFKDVSNLKILIGEYAKYLGLDEDKLVDDFNQFLFDYTSKIQVTDIKKSVCDNTKKVVSPYTKVRKEKITIPMFYVYIFIGLLILVLGYFLITNYDNEKKDNIDNVSIIGGK